jgi:hypothetical protein
MLRRLKKKSELEVRPHLPSLTVQSLGHGIKPKQGESLSTFAKIEKKLEDILEESVEKKIN